MQKLMVSLLVVIGLVLGGFGMASATLLIDENFNNGLTDWSGSGVAIVDIDPTDVVDNVAHLNAPTLPADSAYLYKDFTIASGTSALQVSFDYLFTGTITSGTFFPEDFTFAKLSYQGESTALTTEDLVSSNNLSANYGQWIHFDDTITLSAGSSLEGTLNFMLFETFGATDSYVQVDNVKVSAVPVPNALLLLGSGLAGMALFSRKFVR